MKNNNILALCLLLSTVSAGAIHAFAQTPEPMMEQSDAEPTAATTGPVTVTDVVVDKTDKNAVVARDQAIAAAQKQAFEVLAEKTMSPEAFKSYKVPDVKTIAALVDSFEIQSEQMTANRYVGTFTVRFMPEVTNYIKIPDGMSRVIAAGPPKATAAAVAGNTATATAISSAAPSDATPATTLAPADAVMPPGAAAVPAGPRSVLVLPYYEDAAGHKVLWDDPNPWRDAWQEAGSSTPDKNLTITVPEGDLADVSSGDTDSVWKNDFATVEKSRTNYKATEVALTVAHTGKGIDLYLYHDGKLEREKSLAIKYSDPKAIAKVIAEIKSPVNNTAPASDAHSLAVMPVKDTTAAANDQQPVEDVAPEPQPGAAAVKDDVVAPAVAAGGGKVNVDASMNFSNYAQWMEAQKRLAALNPPVDIEISSLSKDSVQFTMDYEGGDLSAFKSALAGKGIALARPTVEIDESVLGNGKPTQKTVYQLTLQ
jgi:hypothetical protein